MHCFSVVNYKIYNKVDETPKLFAEKLIISTYIILPNANVLATILLTQYDNVVEFLYSNYIYILVSAMYSTFMSVPIYISKKERKNNLRPLQINGKSWNKQLLLS